MATIGILGTGNNIAGGQNPHAFQGVSDHHR